MQLTIINYIKDGIKNTPLVLPYIWIKNLSKKSVGSQSNEAQIIDRLVAKFNVQKSFIEFGFSGWEFNCCNLARNSTGKVCSLMEVPITSQLPSRYFTNG